MCTSMHAFRVVRVNIAGQNRNDKLPQSFIVAHPWLELLIVFFPRLELVAKNHFGRGTTQNM